MTKKLPLSVRQLIEVDACVRCECCRENCPVYIVSTTDESIEFPPSYAGLIDEFKSIVKSRYGLRALLFGRRESQDEIVDHFSKWMYTCVLCGTCSEYCPLLIRTYKLGISFRKWLVKENKEPENFKLIKDVIIETKNVLNMDNDERGDWADLAYSPVKIYEQGEKVDSIYFVGCMLSFSPTIQDMAFAFSEVLNISKTNYAILGDKEWCCGYPLYVTGYEKGLEELINHNIELVKESGAKRVIFSCPSCYLMWKEFYSRKIPNIKLLHEVEILKELVSRRKIKLGKLDMKVTYHDPCDLGRKLGVFDVPREVIRSIPGIDFVELPHNRRDSRCCGGGGVVEAFNGSLPAKVAMLTLKEADELGVDALITACVQCKRTFLKAKRDYKTSLKVLDVAELVYESIQGK